MGGPPGFREITARLVHYLNERVRRGELTERGLARLTGYSQPPIHNVLKGARILGMELADQVMGLLDIPLTSLLTQEELAGRAPPDVASGVPVPILAGYLGGGSSYPRLSPSLERSSLPASLVSVLVSPVLVRAHVDEKFMWPLIWPRDLLLLDRSPRERRQPVFEVVYALSWAKKGHLTRCRRVGQALVVMVDDAADPPPISKPILLENRNILDIVQGKVVWLERELAGPV